jgi:hypothetical protein
MKQDYRATGRVRGSIGNSLMSAAACAAALFGCTLSASAQDADDCIAQEQVPLCGFVWNDLNNNGEQDAGEPGMVVKVYVSFGANPYDPATDLYTETDSNGFYSIGLDADSAGASLDYKVYVVVPAGAEASPADSTGDDLDSDGFSVLTPTAVLSSASVTVTGPLQKFDIDFGISTSSQPQPGTGTPGYWKNHPQAWEGVDTIMIGGVSYDRDFAIAALGKITKDKTTTMFSSLVSAKLNVMIGNDPSCVADTIAAADAWMKLHPLGTNVAGSSAAWQLGEPLHKLMDSYNNGLLCAPHRN